MNNTTKKILAVAGAIVLAGSSIAVGFALDNPETVTVTKEINVTKEVIVEVPVNVIVEKEVEVEKLVEVLIDNGDMEYVLCRLEDKDIISDCDEIVAEFKAEDKALGLVFDYMNSEEFKEDLEDENFVDDEEDARVYNIQKDFDDVTVVDSDFDNEEYEFTVDFKLEDLDEEDKFKMSATFKVEDGEVEFVSANER